MKIHTCCKKVLLFLAMIAVCCFFVGCGSSSNNLSPLEQEEGYYWYEAIFLQKDDVEAAFRTASDHSPIMSTFRMIFMSQHNLNRIQNMRVFTERL